MNNDFSRILTLLRKERGLSQKEASEHLGVSQALLSHYENGKRECGLDFLCTAADFYNVSCDYLLGRTTERTGAVITITEAPAYQGNDSDVSTELLLEKRILMNSLNLLFSLLLQVGSKEISDECSMILMIAVYRVIRILHSTDKSNPKNMFTVPSYNYCALAAGKSSLCEANAINLAKRIHSDSEKASASVSPEKLSEKYPMYAPAALNLIQMVENGLRIVPEKN